MLKQAVIRANGFTLTPLAEGDMQLFVSLHTNPDVMKLIGPCLSVEKAAQLFVHTLQAKTDRTYYYWRLENALSQQVGVVALMRQPGDMVEMGMVLLPEFMAKGYSVPVLAALIEFGCHVWRVAGILAKHRPDNLAAPRLLRRLSFEFGHNDGEFWHWQLPKPQWRQLSGQAPYHNIEWEI